MVELVDWGIITEPHLLAAEIKRLILSRGYDEDGYPVETKSDGHMFHRTEWEVILEGLRVLSVAQTNERLSPQPKGAPDG